MHAFGSPNFDTNQLLKMCKSYKQDTIDVILSKF